jgi:hypothetical protein
LTKKFRAKDYFREHPAAMVLGAMRRGTVALHDAGQRIALKPGDTVISLLPPSDLEHRFSQRVSKGRDIEQADPAVSEDDSPRDPDRLAGT